MNKVVMAALRALSKADIDVRKNYKLERQVQNILHPSLKVLYHIEDYNLTLDNRQVPIRIFSPSKLESKEVLLFFHGGGWVTGNIDNYVGTCGALSESIGRRLISVEYGLAPEFPFPFAVEECYQVAKELYLNCKCFNEEPSDIILIGDSAGGNLCAVVSLMAAERNEFKIHRQILIYPATYNDHSETSPFPSVIENGEHYLLTSKRVCEYMDLYIQNKEDWESPYFAPMLAKDLTNQPTTLIITAEFDPLRDEGEAYGEKLRNFGNQVVIHRVNDAIHGFFSMPSWFEPVKCSYGLIKDFLKETIYLDTANDDSTSMAGKVERK